MLLKELFLQLNEDGRATAVFAFGRFNPPTIGHQKLIEQVQATAQKVNGKGFIILSHSQNLYFYICLSEAVPTSRGGSCPRFLCILTKPMKTWQCQFYCTINTLCFGSQILFSRESTEDSGVDNIIIMVWMFWHHLYLVL